MALMFYIFFALPLITLFLLKKSRQNPNETSRRPPGPPTLPFIGNLHQFDNSRLHICLKELSDKYGPLMHMKLVNKPAVVISSAKVAKEALKDNDLTFSSRPMTTTFAKLSYNNLDIATSPYSDYWRDMRKMVVVQLFTRKQMDSFLPIRAEEVSRMVEEVSNCRNEPVVVNELALAYSSSVICRIAFGKRYDETASGKRQFDSLLHGLQAMSVTMFAADFFPKLAWIDRLMGKYDRLEKAYEGLDSFYQELIDEHLKPNRPDSMNGDMVDLLIQLREKRSADVKFDWDNVKGVIMNMFAAGADTSSASLTWAMTAMIKHPKAMKRVQEEIRGFVGNKEKGNNKLVEEEDLEHLPYLKAVVKETFRFFAPAPLSVPRETMKKCVIDGYEIEPKTMVYVNIWAIARDPQCWENPDEFIPERFLDKNIDFKGHDFEFIPFGSGRRQCPGMPLGAANVELALANLLYSFDWQLPDGMTADDVDLEGLPGITTYKKNPLRLVAKRYEV